MESLLASRFRSQVSKSKDSRMKDEASIDVCYPTGFLNFDFLNGAIVDVNTPEKQFKYYSAGIPDGSLVMCIGRSGSGKTTAVVQMAANIVRPFENSCIFHDDIEGGITTVRRKILTGFTDEELEEKYIIRNSGITAENFYERIKLIYDTKMADEAAFTYDTGLLERFNFGGANVYLLNPALLTVNDDPVADFERPLKQNDDAGNKVVNNVLQTETDTDGKSRSYQRQIGKVAAHGRYADDGGQNKADKAQSRGQ